MLKRIAIVVCMAAMASCAADPALKAPQIEAAPKGMTARE
jgi:hypothetical protein